MERHYVVKEFAEIKGLVAGSTSILFQKYEQISKRPKQSSSLPQSAGIAPNEHQLAGVAKPPCGTSYGTREKRTSVLRARNSIFLLYNSGYKCNPSIKAN